MYLFSESEKSADGDSDTSTRPPSPQPPPPSAQQPPKDNLPDKTAVEVEKKKEPEVPNDNVKAGTSGGIDYLA